MAEDAEMVDIGASPSVGAPRTRRTNLAPKQEEMPSFKNKKETLAETDISPEIDINQNQKVPEKGADKVGLASTRVLTSLVAKPLISNSLFH